MAPTPLIIPIDGRTPEVDAQAWVAPTAVLAGAVTLGAQVGVWYGTVVRSTGFEPRRPRRIELNEHDAGVAEACRRAYESLRAMRLVL